MFKYNWKNLKNLYFYAFLPTSHHISSRSFCHSRIAKWIFRAISELVEDWCDYSVFSIFSIKFSVVCASSWVNLKLVRDENNQNKKKATWTHLVLDIDYVVEFRLQKSLIDIFYSFRVLFCLSISARAILYFLMRFLLTEKHSIKDSIFQKLSKIVCVNFSEIQCYKYYLQEKVILDSKVNCTQKMKN